METKINEKLMAINGEPPLKIGMQASGCTTRVPSGSSVGFKSVGPRAALQFTNFQIYKLFSSPSALLSQSPAAVARTYPYS